MDERDTGLLINSDTLLHRNYFKEMCDLIGVILLYREPKKGSKQYDGNGELDAFYELPRPIGCIFDEHPNQWTMKKLGWVAELQDNVSIVHVPYDTPGLQRGSLFIVPSGIDNSQGRVFMVREMTVSMLYPSSIACQIAPLYISNFDRGQIQHEDNDFNLLNDMSEGFVN